MTMRLHEAACCYLHAGLCVLPARRSQKRPAVRSWKQYQQRLPTAAELSAWMANNPDAICVICGAVSGNLEMIDFDAGGECFASWWERVPAELRDRLVVEITPSGGYHVIYRCAVAVCGNLKLAQRRAEGGDKIVTLIETRGEGGLFLCAPTMGYMLAHGDLCALPVLTEAERDVLLQAAWELNEYVPPAIDGPPHNGVVVQRGPVSGEQGNSVADNPHIVDCPPHNAVVGQTSASSAEQGGMSADNSHRSGCVSDMGARPGDDFNVRGDVRAVLEQHGWVQDRQGANGNEYWRRPGKDSGWSATLKGCSGGRVFYVFSSNAAPFESNRAYSPFSVYALLNHGGDFEQAARSLRQLGFGSDGAADNAAGVDISAIVQMSVGQGQGPSDILHSGDGQTDNREQRPDPADPGPIPEHLFQVPGFIEQVMAFTLANAPYPNIGLAFCGAIALQSFLAGRKVRTPGDLRPNLYLLALASSGTGKDFPRKVNSHVAFEVGLINAVGDKFASGEGIQDALVRTSAMLFQNDEMDGVLRQINLDRENRRESTPNVLLTLYTSANDIYPVRVKAGQKDAVHIDQPHLTLFGTATPQYFYESLSQRMLTNGFFARMIIIDVGKRGPGQDAGSPRDIPELIMQTARWWAEYQPRTLHFRGRRHRTRLLRRGRLRPLRRQRNARRGGLLTMGTAGQFDVDPRKLGTGAFGIDADGRFIICDRCCGPCIYCASAPSGYLVTLGGITLCAGWSGIVAGTYNVPFSGASGFNQSCSYIRRPAFMLYRSGVAYAFWIYFSVRSDGVRLRVLYDRNPYFEVFNNTLGNNVHQPVNDCGFIGGTLTAASYGCGQGTNGLYVAVGTGGWASFEAA